MPRSALMSLMLLACLLGTQPGCALFKKSSSGGSGTSTPAPNTNPNPGVKDPAKFPTDPLLGPTSKNQNKAPIITASHNGLLAGKVIDAYDHPPNNAYIRWVSLEEGKDTGAPIDVAVSAEGYFVIQGLKPGVNYKLLARAKEGERMLAGVTYATAPNSRLIIQVREEFANGQTPSLPGSPALAPTTTPSSTPGNWNPSAKPNQIAIKVAPPNGDEPDLPVSLTVPVQGATKAVPDPGWTPTTNDKAKLFAPTLSVPTIKPPAPPAALDGNIPPPVWPGNNPGLTPPPAPPNNLSPPNPPGMETSVNGGARVPSCIRLGNQVANFALNDINGQPWELKAHRKGRLVLIDFWATFCPPCLESMPKLATLQAKYATSGLEVIGIAYEGSGTPQEQAHKVYGMARKLGVSYRQLLGTGKSCPVLTQFDIQGLPTLVLLDERGMILWRHDGKPDRNKSDELERLIQRHLGQPR